MNDAKMKLRMKLALVATEVEQKKAELGISVGGAFPSLIWLDLSSDCNLRVTCKSQVLLP